MLKGDVDEIQRWSGSWSQSVIGQMMFKRDDKCLGVANLANVAEDVLSLQPAGEEPPADETVIMCLMRLDLQQVLPPLSLPPSLPPPSPHVPLSSPVAGIWRQNLSYTPRPLVATTQHSRDHIVLQSVSCLSPHGPLALCL